MGQDGSCPCFSRNRKVLRRKLTVVQAIARTVYSTDLNIYFMMTYVIPSAVASVLIKYGFILLKIFHVFNTAVS